MKILIERAWRAACAKAGFARPVYAHFGVTHRCNARCRMCSVWRSGNAATELSPAQVDALAENLRRCGVLSIALGGGEPFVRGDLPEIISCFSRRKMEVRVLTNGIAVSDAAIEDAVRAGMRHVSISLDSLDPEKEKNIYNGRDVWHGIVQTAKRFRAALPDHGAIPILNVCANKWNIDELPALAAFAESLDFHCSFVPICAVPDENESDGFAAAAPEMAPGPEDRDKIRAAYGELIRMKRGGARIANSTLFLRHSMNYLCNDRAGWKCDAGLLYLSISPEGGVSICHKFPPFARFDAPDLYAALRDNALRRAAAEQRAACAGCMRPCWAEVSLAAGSFSAALEAALLTIRRNRR